MKYVQLTGKLFTDAGEIMGTGYAGGNCGQNPEGRNNPDMQDAKAIGPLPCGRYRLGEPVMQSHLGPYAIPLIPDASNEMYGRGAFYMHGDRTNAPGCASEGCVIQGRNVREEAVATGEFLDVVRGDE